MKKQITIKIKGKQYSFPAGVTAAKVLKATSRGSRLPALGAIIFNRLVDPDYRLNYDTTLKIVTYKDWQGVAIYRRSATLILIEAVHQLFPKRRLVIGQSVAEGYFFDLYLDRPLEKEDISRIEERMRRIVSQDRPFEIKYVSYREAKTYFEEQRLQDKIKLLPFLRASDVCLVSCGDFQELYSGPVAPTTGTIAAFALEPYQEGFVLRFPTWEEKWKLSDTVKKEVKLFNIYRETRQWNNILSVENVGQLNELCVSGRIRELIIIAESLHEKKIAAIADEIARRRKEVRLVLIAGPSASGKTTFAKRLIIQLKVAGLQPVALSLDNYFKNRDQTPRDETGEVDFESLHALDLKLFNQHLGELFHDREVEVPQFDFKKGERREKGVEFKFQPGGVLLIEGIHCLNDQVSQAVPESEKFKIYISALTQLCIDDHNRILTSDTRLLRRIVRDRIHRGWNASDTISLWPSVRRGENRNIFPFQESADVIFNSALVYEQAVLKNHAELGLLDVAPDDPNYVEAHRLLQFLSFFAPISERDVPSTSILREFIGDSFFSY